MLHWPLAPWLLNQLAHHGGGYTGGIHTQTYVCMHAHMNRHMRARKTYAANIDAMQGQAKQFTNYALRQEYPTEGKLTIFCKLIISSEKASEEI